MITVEGQTSSDPAMVDGATGLFERIRGYAESVEATRGIIQEAANWRAFTARLRAH